MCGIIGYEGKRDAFGILLTGLKRLEYRGYDSWGIALRSNPQIHLTRRVGKVGDATDEAPLPSTMGIAHTRWATHGGITEANAHPHISCDKKIAVIHNGIIENYQELRRELAAHTFSSETDTEVIPHLIEEYGHLGFEEATRQALLRLKGNYALVVMHQDSPHLIAARRGSPLVLGLSEEETFVASDPLAFQEYTSQVLFLEEGEMALLSKKPILTRIQDGTRVERRAETLSLPQKPAEKEGYPHFMLKEIFEQGDAIGRTIQENLEKAEGLSQEINKSFGTFFVACGTAYHAALAASYTFSKIAKKHINVVLASEFPNYEHFLTPQTLVIPISQSGETSDVLEAVKTAKKKKAKVIAIVNVPGSSLTRLADESLLTCAGTEVAVASTKAFTSQLALLTLLAYACTGQCAKGQEVLLGVSALAQDLLRGPMETKVKALAGKLKEKEHLFTIGRSTHFPIALESALKIKEVSYIHAEGFAGGELKHGTLALIEQGTPCIVFVADEEQDEILGNAMEIRSRGGYIIGIAAEPNAIFHEWIPLPHNSPLLSVMPAQLLAYHLAVERGCDVDRCRNLAKSVTVK